MTPQRSPTTDPHIVPFEDFSTAARAVFGRLCDLHEQPVEELMAKLLSTVLIAEQRADEASRRAEAAEAESLYDPLTGLLNRRAWVRVLTGEENRCRRHDIPASVIVIDLDDLKQVNDTLGHTAGDDILRRAARLAVAHVRAHDVVARLGGDEFGVLATHCRPDEARLLARRIGDALTEEDISASIGVAARDPTHGLHPAWEEADSVMYEQKRRRKITGA